MAAEAAARDRAAPDQCAGRHHQLHDLRPRAAAARVRRREGARQSHRPARPHGREPARARRTHLSARRVDLRHHRREGCRVALRHHGRRGNRLLGRDHRRADRVRAVEPAQHRADRSQARHQFGCALPLRARRRSELHGAGPGACHADGARFLRRHAFGDRCRGVGACRGSRHRVSHLRGEAPVRP